jgi:hypothetical protein
MVCPAHAPDAFGGRMLLTGKNAAGCWHKNIA